MEAVKLGCLGVVGLLGAAFVLAFFLGSNDHGSKTAAVTSSPKAQAEAVQREAGAAIDPTPHATPPADAGTDWKPPEHLDGPFPASGGEYADMDRITTDAVLIGRGIACNVPIMRQSQRVSDWLEKVAPPSADNHRAMMDALQLGISMNAKAQASGESPDDCPTVGMAIRDHWWP
jgi:hypothetical protein